MEILKKITPKKLLTAFIHYLPTRIANDKYVPYFYVRPYRYLTLITLIQKMRIKYWTSIASKYEPFKPFYINEERERAISDNSKLFKGIKNIYKNGYSVCSDFLEDEDLIRIKEYIYKIKIDPDKNSGYITENVPSMISDKIIEKLEPYYSHFFPNYDFSINPPSLIIRIDYSKNGIDPAPITANWHVDRFIPTLNAIYFPEGSDWGSFEKDTGNPVIDNNYIEYFSKFRQSTANITDLRDAKYKDLNSSRRLFNLSKNSLLIGTHHMQHRRSPYFEPGKRVAIFIDFYNVLTRSDLKKSAK